MRTLARIAIFGGALACALAASQWLADPGLRRIPPAPAPRAEAQPTPPPLSEAAEPLIAFGGAYGEASAGVSVDEGRVHYALGAELLHLGDSYSAASHLALARTALGDYGRICELLAVAYDTLNMTLDLLEIMDCLEREAQQRHSAKALFERLSRQLDVEFEFQAAASDHFVASFPSNRGPSAAAIGQVLDHPGDGRAAGSHADIGFASMRLVPVVIYEGGQLEAATDSPHWALPVSTTVRSASPSTRSATKPEWLRDGPSPTNTSTPSPTSTPGRACRRGSARGSPTTWRTDVTAAHPLFAGSARRSASQLLYIRDLEGPLLGALPRRRPCRAYRQSLLDAAQPREAKPAGERSSATCCFDLHGRSRAPFRRGLHATSTANRRPSTWTAGTTLTFR